MATKGKGKKRASNPRKPAPKTQPANQPISVVYHPAAHAEILNDLDPTTQSDVLGYVSSWNGKTHQELVGLLDKRTEKKVFQWESSHPRGTLRIVVAWGGGKLWVIGAFVKNNDPQGERFVQRILHRVAEVQ